MRWPLLFALMFPALVGAAPDSHTLNGDQFIRMMSPQDPTGYGNRAGVVSFFRIAGGPGGHIDLIHPGPYGFSECLRNC